MDSAGINALVGAYHRKLPNGELGVIGMRSNLQRVFEITGLVALFQDHQQHHVSGES
jgi:anti-anti-sigma factor